MLPAGMRDPVGLAYLLARAADTIADTSLIPPEQRLELLLSLRDQVNGAPDDGARSSAWRPKWRANRPSPMKRSCWNRSVPR